MESLNYLLPFVLLIIGGVFAYLLSRLFKIQYHTPDFENIRKSGLVSILAVLIGVFLVSAFFFIIKALPDKRIDRKTENADSNTIDLPAQFDSVAIEEILPEPDSLFAADAGLMKEMTYVKDSCPKEDNLVINKSKINDRDFSFGGVLSQIFLALFLLVPVYIALMTMHEPLNTAGINTRNLWGSILIGAILTSLMLLINLYSDFSAINLRVVHFWAFCHFAVVGFTEELVFRGYLQTRLMAWLKTIPGWLLASVIMALSHIAQRMTMQGMDPGTAFLSSLALLPLSLFFGYVYLRTGNIWAVSILHTFANWVSTLK